MVTHTIVVEFDPATGHYTATVPGYPGIVADAKSERSVVRMATKAIRMYNEEMGTGTANLAPPLRAKIVSVDV